MKEAVHDTVKTQISMPRDVVETLHKRGTVRGMTVAQQILEAVIAYLNTAADNWCQMDPILQPNDPIFKLAGATHSHVHELSTEHDRYLYGKDWETPHTQEVTS